MIYYEIIFMHLICSHVQNYATLHVFFNNYAATLRCLMDLNVKETASLLWTKNLFSQYELTLKFKLKL